MGFGKSFKKAVKRVTKNVSTAWDKWGKDAAIGIATGGVGLGARALYKGYQGMMRAQKEMADAEMAAAQQYADAQDRVANAIENSSQTAPHAVQATNVSPQEVAESNAYAQQKRKRTIASTLTGGSLGGRSSLGG